MTAVYWVRGCSGSQRFEEVNFFGSAAEARRLAAKLNQASADGLGLSMRGYRRRSEWDEGWATTGKMGLDGRKTGR